MDEVMSRRFPVRTPADLNTDEKVTEVRRRLEARSATYRTMKQDPFSLIASGGGHEDDIPF